MEHNEQPEGCKHPSFEAKVTPRVLFQDEENKIISGYNVELEFSCALCKCPFEFIDIPFIQNPDNTTPFADGTFSKATLPLKPARNENKIVTLPFSVN